MRHRQLSLLLIALVAWPAIASAQRAPVGPWPGVTVPIFGISSAVDGGGSFSPQLFGPQSCTVPAYSFTGATTSGYGSSSGNPCIVVSGTAILTTSATAFTSTVPYLAPEGAVGTPSLAPSGAPTTGIFFDVANNRTNFTAAGIGVARISTGGYTTTGSLAFESSFGAGSDVSLSRLAADRLGQVRSTNAQRADVANTYTSSTNNELFSVDWQTTAGVAVVGTRTAATGTVRPLQLVSQFTDGSTAYSILQINRGGVPFLQGGIYTGTAMASASNSGTGNWIQFADGTSTATSGTVNRFAITPTYNQSSGTAANTDLLINRTETAVGSGAQLLADFQVGSASKFRIDNTGGIGFASLAISGTAPSVPVACTTPTVVNSNGTASFEIDVGTTCAGVTTLAITMPAVANSYHCTAINLTTGTMAPEMTASTSTSITITNFTRITGLATDWADGANVSIGCVGR